MSRHVLVVGDPTDPHVEAVVGACRNKGASCTVVSELKHRISFDLDDGLSDAADGGQRHTLRPDTTTAVWWRRKPDYFRLENSDSYERFRDREWLHTLEALEGVFASARWVNPRIADRHFRHKPNQLLLARDCGLTIPRTLVSNDPAKVLAFVRKLPGLRCIYKPLSWFHIERESVFTNVVSADTVAANAEAISRAPGIFQELIEKQFELRITVVANRIFAVKIDSQSREDTRIDWRRNQFDVPYARLDHLDPAFAKLLLAFHDRSGLVYGAYDVICDLDGRYVFLEVNPVGQWLWLELLTGVQISDALADVLVGR